MSLQQQCLPVPQRQRKRRIQSEYSDIAQNSHPAEHANTYNQEAFNHDHDEPLNAPPTAPLEISSLESMDALEYMAFVRNEASKLPDVFVSKVSQDHPLQSNTHNNDYINNNPDGLFRPSSNVCPSPLVDGSAVARDYLFSRRLEVLPPPSCFHVPNPSVFTPWKEQTMSNFSALRVYLCACRSEFQKWMKPEDRILVPQSKDLYAWHVFCLGNDIRNEMEHKMIHVQMNEADHDLTAVEVDVLLSPYKIPEGGYEPTTKLMCQFDQIIIRRLLSHHTRYIAAGCRLTVKRIKWIYAILAMLDKPLHRDEASVLMELLRELCRVRSMVRLETYVHEYTEGGHPVLNQESETYNRFKWDKDVGCSVEKNEMEIVKAINVIILLIGLYFEQYTNLGQLFVYDPLVCNSLIQE